MRSSNGWFPFPRKVAEQLLRDSRALQVYVDLASRAAHGPKTIMHGRQRIRLERGQVLTGRAAIAARTGLSEKAIRTAIKFLEERASIVAIKRANKYSLITVELPPVLAHDGPAERPAEGPAKGRQKGQQKGHNKELKNKILNTGANNGVRPLLSHYAERFKATVGVDPDISWGKDGKILKGLLAARGEEAVRDLLDRFFSSPDQFIRQSGYSIGAFKTCLNKLLATGPGRAGGDEYVGAGGRRLETVS